MICGNMKKPFPNVEQKCVYFISTGSWPLVHHWWTIISEQKKIRLLGFFKYRILFSFEKREHFIYCIVWEMKDNCFAYNPKEPKLTTFSPRHISFYTPILCTSRIYYPSHCIISHTIFPSGKAQVSKI